MKIFFETNKIMRQTKVIVEEPPDIIYVFLVCPVFVHG